MTGPLNGIRVIECSTVAIGRWAAQTLGDLDAKVIKPSRRLRIRYAIWALPAPDAEVPSCALNVGT